MGICNLLKEIKSILKPISLTEIQNSRVGIDGNCWIHRGSSFCARELYMSPETCTGYINFFMKMIKLLQANHINDIVVVFDGKSFGLKKQVNTDRSARKAKYLQLAREAYARGAYDDADKYFRQSVIVTSVMVQLVIAELKLAGIPFIISPYESDAQLAFMSQSYLVDWVITEDSDLIVFGCRQILFKLDHKGLGNALKRRELGSNEGMSFSGWTNEQFKLFCCLSGCDYLQNIPGVGIRKAYGIVKKSKGLKEVASEVRHLLHSAPGAAEVYLLGLERAMAAFSHQVVFNPESNRLQYLTDIPVGKFPRNYDFSYLGEFFDDSLAALLARGEIDSDTMTKYKADDIYTRFHDSLPCNTFNPNIWSFEFEPAFTCNGSTVSKLQTSRLSNTGQIAMHGRPKMKLKVKTGICYPLYNDFRSKLVSNNFQTLHRRRMLVHRTVESCAINVQPEECVDDVDYQLEKYEDNVNCHSCVSQNENEFTFEFGVDEKCYEYDNGTKNLEENLHCENNLDFCDLNNPGRINDGPLWESVSIQIAAFGSGLRENKSADYRAQDKSALEKSRRNKFDYATQYTKSENQSQLANGPIEIAAVCSCTQLYDHKHLYHCQGPNLPLWPRKQTGISITDNETHIWVTARDKSSFDISLREDTSCYALWPAK